MPASTIGTTPQVTSGTSSALASGEVHATRGLTVASSGASSRASHRCAPSHAASAPAGRCTAPTMTSTASAPKLSQKLLLRLASGSIASTSAKATSSPSASRSRCPRQRRAAMQASISTERWVGTVQPARKA